MLTELATIILSCFHCGFSLMAQELILFFSKNTVLLRGERDVSELCVSDCATRVHDVLFESPVVQAVEVDSVGTEGAVEASLWSHTETRKMK